MSSRLPVRRTILVVDVEGFSRPERPDPSRAVLRESLFRVLEDALERAGVERQAWSRLDTGDGGCILLDPEVSEVLLLEQCLAEMRVGLREFNRDRREDAMLRLRVVLHSGHVAADAYGWSGQQLNVAFRLLDSAPLRQALRSGPAPMAVMVSEPIYEVVRHDWRDIDADDWRRVEIQVKEWRGHAWLYAPGHHGTRGPGEPPGRPEPVGPDRHGPGDRRQGQVNALSYIEHVDVQQGDLVFDQRRMHGE